MGLDMYLEADIHRGDPDPRARAVFEAIDQLFPGGEKLPADPFPGAEQDDDAALCELLEMDSRIERVRAVIARHFPFTASVGNHWIGARFSRNRIKIPLCYWRKANQIHGWFVREVQDGVDECDRHEVSREQLFELRKRVKTIEADHSRAEELLPSEVGFFFGTYEYDEWYFENVKYTREQLDRICESGLTENASIHYQSSW